jgi:hypothetical protein
VGNEVFRFKNWLLDERGVVVDIVPRKRIQRYRARNGLLEERCGGRYSPPKEDAKMWSKKRLLGRKVWQQICPRKRLLLIAPTSCVRTRM